MQNYTEIAPETTIQSSLTLLLNNTKTALSQSSGTAFPTTNLYIGMPCIRTDESTKGKLYILTAIGPAVWTYIMDLDDPIGPYIDGGLYALTASLGTLASLSTVTAAQLDVVGNGSTTQFLRSDADGSFTWAVPINTTYSAGTGLTLAATTFSVNYGTTVTTACVGNDTRLSNSRQCNNNFDNSATARTNLGLGYYATLAQSSAIAITNATNATSATTGAIQTSGGVGVALDVYAGGNVTAYSDIRLKTNIQVIPDALDKVKQLSGYTFDRTDRDLRQTGVIAQEVLKVLPEAVSGSEEEMYGVNYGAMVGLLIEAIKEQQVQIDELKLKVQEHKHD